MNRLVYVLFSTLLSITGIVHGQDIAYNFRQISIDQGLPGQNVRQVYQDFNGVVWISVEAIGLSRYDGRKFELYKHSSDNPNSISSNYVNAIIESKDSILWIATDNGLNRYIRSNNSFKKYYADTTKKNGLCSSLIHSLMLDSQGNLWIGTGEGLNKYIPEKDSFEKVHFSNDPSAIAVRNIYEHSSGLLYLSTNKGLIQYNKNTGDYKHWSATGDQENGPIHQNIRCVIEDNYGNLWVGTHRGINKFNFKEERFEVYSYDGVDREEFENEGYNSAFKYNNRYLWFASYTSGIVIIDTETEEYQRILKNDIDEGSLKSNHIRAIYRDRSGLLWVSTKFEGVFIYDRRKEMFNKIPEKYSLFQEVKNMHVLSFYKDSYKNVFWLGSKYNGLFKIDLNENKVTNYAHDIYDPSSIASNRVHDIIRDRNGDIWVGLGNGFDRFVESSGKFQHLGTAFVDAIAEDKNGNIWVGATEGVFIVDNKGNKLKRHDSPYEFFQQDMAQILNILLDKSGRLWFSTRFNGLYRYNPTLDELKHYSSSSEGDSFMDANMIRPVIEDRFGNIWIGTKANGLYVFNPQTEEFKRYATEDGLPTNFILGIQEDFNGNLWLGTHNGLSFFDSSEEQFTNYTTVHGLQGNIFELATNGIFDDGYILFGGHNGLNVFHPEQINNFSVVKSDSVLFTSLKIYDDEILRDFSDHREIELSYDQNYLTIEFVLVDYVDPLKHHFKYRMKGINDKWFDLGNKNYVTFSSLPPGNYSFELIGINEYGISSKQPLQLDIIVKPPYYATSLFKAFVILILGLIIYVLVRNRNNRNRSVREYLEAEIKERTEKLLTANKELLNQNALIEAQKKEIQGNKEELEVKVKERTKDLELAKVKAEESDKLKSSFLANMSHEIRTPLNAILGFSSLISNAVEDNPEFKFYQESIDSNSEMLVKIVDDVLDISKIEAGQLQVKKRETSLLNLFNEVYEIYKQQLDRGRKSRVDLIFNNPLHDNEDLIIETDKFRLKQILYNLLSNAIKFTAKGYVEFGFKVDYSAIKFYVKDTGVGIPKNDFDSIFERFVKIEDHEELYRGNGLGLSLSKSLVELLGGKIWVDSLIGHGSTFYFTIPDTNSKKLEVDSGTIIKEEKEVKLINDGKKKILIVEDESSNYQYLEALLRITNNPCIWAHNGEEAIKILQSDLKETISIVLLDIKMPRMDGYQTFDKFKELGLDIPVIAVTAYAQSEDKEKIIQYGFNDYIPKPVSKQRLLEVIQKQTI